VAKTPARTEDFMLTGDSKDCLASIDRDENVSAEAICPSIYAVELTTPRHRENRQAGMRLRFSRGSAGQASLIPGKRAYIVE
jgi:hypothetical protein